VYFLNFEFHHSVLVVIKEELNIWYRMAIDKTFYLHLSFLPASQLFYKREKCTL